MMTIININIKILVVYKLNIATKYIAHTDYIQRITY